jgi:hypothetical protein
VEYDWLEGQFDRLPALMADLVRRRVAVIATPAGNYAAQVAKAATTAIPIPSPTAARSEEKMVFPPCQATLMRTLSAERAGCLRPQSFGSTCCRVALTLRSISG